MMPYNYIISKRASNKINSFYRNVAKKYKHTYSFEQMCKNLREAYTGAYQIENGLSRRNPTIHRWEGKGLMANTKKWYYLYKLEGDTIYVIDACHAQNIHESIDFEVSKYIRDYLHSNRMMLPESYSGTRRFRLKENQLREMVGYVVRQIIN